MQNSKQTSGMSTLHLLNFLTTILGIVWCFLLLGILFVSIVSFITNTEQELFNDLISLFASSDSQSMLFLIIIIFFLILSISMLVIRWFARKWIAQGDGKKYLLTWKKLRENRKTIIKVTWGMFQLVWAVLLVVVIPVAINVIGNYDLKTFMQLPIFGPSLGPRLALSAIITFFFLSVILRMVVHNLPKDENIISLKGLDPIHQSLDAVSKELQMLQDHSQRVLQHADEQFIKELTEKIAEPLQKQLEEEKIARKDLEAQMQHLMQYPNTSSTPAATPSVPMVPVSPALPITPVKPMLPVYEVPTQKLLPPGDPVEKEITQKLDRSINRIPNRIPNR